MSVKPYIFYWLITFVKILVEGNVKIGLGKFDNSRFEKKLEFRVSLTLFSGLKRQTYADTTVIRIILKFSESIS